MPTAPMQKKFIAIPAIFVGFLIFWHANALADVNTWQKGANISPTSPTDFSSASFDQSLESLKAANANAVSFVIPLAQTSVATTDIGPTGDTPTDASLVHAIQLAHSLGMMVTLKPHVDPRDGQWRANINPTDRTAWFANYNTYLMHYAELAQANHVEQIVIGTELMDMSSEDDNPTNTANWETLIANVRAVYSGSLVYAANWGTGWADEKDQIGFWDKLDYAGVDAYYPLGSDPNDDSVPSLESYWDTWNQTDIFAFAARVQKPILFTEIGYMSTTGAHINPGDYTVDNGANQTEQANDYQALFSYWNNVSFVKGMYFWEWQTEPPADSASDTNYTPQGKEALNVISEWYGGTGVATPMTSVPQGITIMATPASNPVALGQSVGFSVAVENSGTTTDGQLVDIEIYDGNNQKVFQQFFSDQTLSGDQTTNYNVNWLPSGPGTYTIKAGVFADDWSQNYYWNNSAGAVAVDEAIAAPPQQASFTASASTAPNSAIMNQTTTIDVSVMNTGDAVNGALVDVETYDANNQRVQQNIFSGQSFGVGGQSQYQVPFVPAVAENYRVAVGIASDDWSTMYTWVNSAGEVSATSTLVSAPVSSSSVPVTPSSTPPQIIAPSDTTPPSVPTNVNVQATSPNSVLVSWNPSADNVAVAGYRVYRNGTEIASTTSTSYADQNLQASTPYSYSVSAYDSSNNESAQSPPQSVTTPAPLVPPTVPGNVSAVANATTSIQLTWNSASGNPLIAGYSIYRNGSRVASTSNTSYVDTGLSPATGYSYAIASYNASGTESAESQSVSATTQSLPPPPVVVPPASPVIDVWWPTNDATISGVAPFKAMIENAGVDSYRMYWQVDGGALNPMSDNATDWPHKEAEVDVSGWSWDGGGPYAVTFVAEDANGNEVASTTVSIQVWD